MYKRQAWVRDELMLLIDALTPTARDLNCEAELKLIEEILDRGAGYQRQREIFRETGTWQAAVDASARELVDWRL